MRSGPEEAIRYSALSWASVRLSSTTCGACSLVIEAWNRSYAAMTRAIAASFGRDEIFGVSG
jgi:hypothetical protein